MDGFATEVLLPLVSFLNDSVIWSYTLIFILILTGAYFSIRMRFFQVRLIKDMVYHMLHGEASATGVSSFQGFAMALGGRVGTGNIAGVATAIFNGGPGAVFWMWMIAFLGSSTAYIESALAQVFKEEIDGEYRGGPAYYIEKGLGMKNYAMLFAAVAVVAIGLFLPVPQAYNIAESMHNGFGVPVWITAPVLALACFGLVVGGAKRIGRFAEMVVPFMAIAYIILALIIFFKNYQMIPEIFGSIFRSAFGADAVYGGILGSAVMWGVKRGLFSNEAGQGTGPTAAAAAEVSHPAKQGLVQGFSVYVDTLFVCSATAFMILSTNMFNVSNGQGGFLVQHLDASISSGPAYTQMAVDTLWQGFGPPSVAIALLLFAFTTIIAYYYYAESNLVYLTRHRKDRKGALLALRVAFLLMVLFGGLRESGLAWTIGDIGVGATTWLNIIAILLLGELGIVVLKDYEAQKSAGADPVFDPAALGISHADLWHRIRARAKTASKK